MSKTLRGGRLPSKRSDAAEFTSSIKDDLKLATAVIDINKAHVVMLREQNIIKSRDAAGILQALSAELNLKMDSSSEDVHMTVEEAVLEFVGEKVGGNMHIAKSRNDQVATAIRMELRERILDIMLSITEMQKRLLETAQRHVETIILEYTHLQPAQPVTFAHYLLSRFDALNRDLQRMQGTYHRVNLCPMGAGALATTSFPISRERVAELLGFDDLVENSIDAVGSRDFVLETLGALTSTAVNLSQLAEDLIVWSSPEFGILELPDDFASTSSMMPQKKNPEVPEVVRARAGHIIGDFVAVATALKGLPSVYDLDFQEVTPKLWDAVENVDKSLKILAGLMPNLKVQANVHEKGLRSFVAATELANMLVRKYNVPFRSAHKVVGALVKLLIGSKQTLRDATPNLIQKVAKDTAGVSLTVEAKDIEESIDLRKIVESHSIRGGPSPATVNRSLRARNKVIANEKANVLELKHKLGVAKKKLESTAKSIADTKISGNGSFKSQKREVE